MRIALTGGIASGKSTILRYLRELGVQCLSADAVAQDLLWSPNIQREIQSRFSTTEPLSPATIKALLGSSDEDRRAVNHIFHPAVQAEIERSSAVVVEIPLLFETCMHASFDAIWVAFCSRETQTKRLKERYGDEAKFAQFGWQLGSKVGLSFADAVISTEGGRNETYESLLQEAKRWSISLVDS